MSMTARESLRQLCSDYFHGMMSTDAYRQRRASLLDEAILPHAVPMEADTEHAPTRATAHGDAGRTRCRAFTGEYVSAAP